MSQPSQWAEEQHSPTEEAEGAGEAARHVDGRPAAHEHLTTKRQRGIRFPEPQSATRASVCGSEVRLMRAPRQLPMQAFSTTIPPPPLPALRTRMPSCQGVRHAYLPAGESHELDASIDVEGGPAQTYRVSLVWHLK
jgi:hypothetical protein